MEEKTTPIKIEYDAAMRGYHIYSTNGETVACFEKQRRWGFCGGKKIVPLTEIWLSNKVFQLGDRRITIEKR